MENSHKAKTYFFKNLPKAKNSRKIAILLKLGKIPIIDSIFLKKITKLFICAKNVQIYPKFFCINGNIEAEDVFLHDAFCIDYGLIKIGRHTIFSFQVMIFTAKHDMDDFRKVIVEPVIIGENVYIGPRAIILSGVKIGDNTVIGAGSVVTRDIPSGVLAAGVPCRVIRQINRDKIKWWENDKTFFS